MDPRTRLAIVMGLGALATQTPLERHEAEIKAHEELQAKRREAARKEHEAREQAKRNKLKPRWSRILQSNEEDRARMAAAEAKRLRKRSRPGGSST